MVLLKNINISNYSQIDVFELKQSYLDAVSERKNANKHCTDFLKYISNEKYENIIMNLPYIKFKIYTRI